MASCLGLGLTGAASARRQYVKDGLVLHHRYYNPPQTMDLSFPSNGSAVFNGTSDYVSLGTDTIGIETSSFTISYWAYITNTSWRSVQNRGTGSFGTTAGIQISSTTPAYTMYNTCIENASGDYINFSASSFTANVWQYHTLTFDTTTGTGKLYFDGSLSETETNSNLIGEDFTALDWQIGRSNQDTQHLDGNLANVAFWNRALTSDEINSVMWKDYDNLSASEQSGLQAWYSLDDIDGTSVPDSTGNYNGTAY